VLALRALGINPATYDAALRAVERQWRVIVRVLNNNDAVVDVLTGHAQQDTRLMSGSINYDADADVTRAAEMTLLDPGRELLFEDSVQDGALWPNRFLSIDYGVRVAGVWADVPVFYGRLSAYARDGDQVTLAATGREADHRDPAFFNTKIHIPKGTLIATAIRRILAAHGETHFAFGNAGGRRTHQPIDMVPTDEAWSVAKRLAADANRHLFFDGTGTARLRSFGGDDPVWTFDGNNITNAPSQSFDLEELRNVIRVRGKVPDKGDGKKQPPAYTALPHPADPLHPRNLGLSLIEFVDDDHVTSTPDARRLAERLLDQRMKEAVGADFNAFPVPHIEEGDPLALKMDGLHIAFAAKRWTLPLDGSEMSMGSTKFVRIKKAKP
jgi:hypothetical protein